jgi:hypothetical protein
MDNIQLLLKPSQSHIATNDHLYSTRCLATREMKMGTGQSGLAITAASLTLPSGNGVNAGLKTGYLESSSVYLSQLSSLC